jgi:hypothetical protein
MPYMSAGKSVYKKLPGGKRGKKVGTTKGSVKKYMAALHANTDKSYSKEHYEWQKKRGMR